MYHSFSCASLAPGNNAAFPDGRGAAMGGGPARERIGAETNGRGDDLITLVSGFRAIGAEHRIVMGHRSAPENESSAGAQNRRGPDAARKVMRW